MYKFTTAIATVLLAITISSHADSPKTTRIPQFFNEEVDVWKTIIYPTKNQILKMHRHEHNRVLIAFTDGTLKIINDKGQVHYLKLEKEHAYFLTKNIPGELHADENMGKYPIRVLVVELKK